MKKVIITLLTLVTSLTYAQNPIFSKLENNDDITSVVVTKKAFMMLKKVTSGSKEAEEFKQLIEGLDELRVLTSETQLASKELKNIFSSYVKSAKLEELMRVSDKDANVKIYVKNGKTDNYVSEFLMLVDEIRTGVKSNEIPNVALISLTGNINLNDVAKITQEMNLPGIEAVEKSTKTRN